MTNPLKPIVSLFDLLSRSRVAPNAVPAPKAAPPSAPRRPAAATPRPAPRPPVRQQSPRGLRNGGRKR
jgi:hypothetical protein